MNRGTNIAADRFAQLGFPSSRSEEWRYTNPASFSRLATEPPVPSELDASQLAEIAADEPRLVFVAGKLRDDLSTTPVGLDFESLARVPFAGFDRALERADHGFIALNLARFTDGASIKAKPGAEKRVLHLASVGPKSGGAHLRHAIELAPRAELLVVESHFGGGSGLTNVVVDVMLGEGASLEWVKLVDEGDAAHHVGRIEVEQAKGSRFSGTIVQLGGRVARTEIVARLGDRAECNLGGLYVSDGDRISDNFSLIEHRGDHGSSKQLYKGVLGGASTATFYGKVRVHEDTHRNDARQTSKSLLLGEGATANTRPQLEIYSEDVQCSHGATVGRLDEEHVFYLRSRGVGEKEAREMLTFAFAQEVLDAHAPSRVRARLEARVKNRLARLR
jgi:Fe-S cluster assembly protein SufD